MSLEYPRFYIANISPTRPECLECGFLADINTLSCPKCDADLETQTDGSVHTIDIAHHGETVEQALVKLKNTLSVVRLEYPQYLRIIVGRGKIAEQVLGYVEYLKRAGDIIKYEPDGKNRGAVILQLKPDKAIGRK